MAKVFTFDTEEEWLALRAEDVTSTECSALFGKNKWLTKFDLFHRKRGSYAVPFNDNEPMKWGRRLEPVIAQGIAQDNGLTIEPLKCYMRHDTIEGMGSSFDYQAWHPDHGSSPGLLEIKNVGVNALSDWIMNGDDIEAPLTYELQVQHQLAVTGFKWAKIGVLIGGNQAKILHRERNAVIIARIEKEITQFWRDIRENKEPDPDFARDGDALHRLYMQSNPEAVFDDREASKLRFYAAEVTKLNEEEKKIKAEIERRKAQMRKLLGSVEKVELDGYRISSKTQKRKAYTVEAAEFRPIRITKIGGDNAE